MRHGQTTERFKEALRQGILLPEAHYPGERIIAIHGQAHMLSEGKSGFEYEIKEKGYIRPECGFFLFLHAIIRLAEQ